MVCVVGHAEHNESGDVPEGLEDGPFAVGNARRFLWGRGWRCGLRRCFGGFSMFGAHVTVALGAAPPAAAVTVTKMVDEFAGAGLEGSPETRVGDGGWAVRPVGLAWRDGDGCPVEVHDVIDERCSFLHCAEPDKDSAKFVLVLRCRLHLVL